MTVVIDASLVTALVLPLPYSDRATARVVEWKHAGVELVAPWLLQYEISTVLRRAVAAGLLTAEMADEAMKHVLALDIRYLPPTSELHQRAAWWAARLDHTKPYDAHYVALAEQWHAELWTADRRLVNAAQQVGTDWVRWVGEEYMNNSK